MTDRELSFKILGFVGGAENISSFTNCMTRLRFNLKNDDLIQREKLESIDGVLGIVKDRSKYIEVVVGPGRVRKCADILKEAGISSAGEPDGRGSDKETENKTSPKSATKNGKVKHVLKLFGEIFAPLIPGIIAAGLCAGFASLLSQLVPGYAQIPAWNLIYNILTLINVSFMTYITAWAGYRAAEKFGGTPILGGMLGMITMLGNIDVISQIIGLYNVSSPLDSVLRSGRGGVLAVILGVWVMCKIEKLIRKKMPDSLDTVFTPVITLIAGVVPFILVFMPLIGFISTGLCDIVEMTALNANPIVRIAAGFICAAIFLPMVAMGMHHGLIALYTVQLDKLGYITLYPSLAMAGFGQVGAALAIYIKAKHTGNLRLKKIIAGALPAGVMGVGEPLVYGVTLPMGKPFLTAGIGAGFGGAFIMLMEVASTTWGPSGLLGAFVMTGGPNGAVMSIIYFCIGLAVSFIMGFLITWLVIKDQDVADA